MKKSINNETSEVALGLVGGAALALLTLAVALPLFILTTPLRYKENRNDHREAVPYGNAVS